MTTQDKNNIINNNNSGEIIIYEGADGAPSIDVFCHSDSSRDEEKSLGLIINNKSKGFLSRCYSFETTKAKIQLFENFE